ncbi:hypothetical protein Nmel_012069, partial [Mimus melanotis]
MVPVRAWWLPALPGVTATLPVPPAVPGSLPPGFGLGFGTEHNPAPDVTQPSTPGLPIPWGCGSAPSSGNVGLVDPAPGIMDPVAGTQHPAPETWDDSPIPGTQLRGQHSRGSPLHAPALSPAINNKHPAKTNSVFSIPFSDEINMKNIC